MPGQGADFTAGPMRRKPVGRRFAGGFAAPSWKDIPIESELMGGNAIEAAWEGRTLDGQYALLKYMGGGSDGSGVFLTVRQLIEPAAIKLIAAQGAEAEAILAQWEEAKGLVHPHLLQLYEVGHCVSEGVPVVYVVTERAHGTLARTIRERAISSHAARSVFHPILDALSYLHAEGYVHGAVKPSNILDVEGEWKLSSDRFLAFNGESLPIAAFDAYDAPEVGGSAITGAADTWSFGITLAESLTRQRPVWDRAAQSEPLLPESLPEPLLDVVHSCLRMMPADRCSIAEIKTALANAAVLPFSGHEGPPIATAASAAEPLPSRAPGFAPPADRPAERATAAPPPAGNRIPAAGDTTDRGPLFEPWPASAASPPPPYPETFGVEPGRIVEAEPAGPGYYGAPPALFSHIDDDDRERKRFPWVLTILGVVILFGLIEYQKLRGGQQNPLSLLGIAASPQATQSAPQPQPAAAESQPAPSPSVENPSASSGDAASTPETASTPTAQPAPAQSAAAPTGARPVPTTAGDTNPAGPSSPPASPSTPNGAPRAQAPAEIPLPSQAAPRPAAPQNGEGAVLDKVMPNISPSARMSMHGPVTVVLRVTVNRSGSVADVSYVSPGPGNYFARASERAAQAWKFSPPAYNGRSEESVWILHFYFSRRGTEVSVQEASR